jgi:hemolysin activation/secretion protein
MFFQRLFIFFMLLFFSALSFAVVNPGIPSAADAGLVQKRLQSRPALPPLGGAAVQQAAPQTELPPDVAKIKFLLKKVIFTGNTVTSDQELEAYFRPYLNRMISLGELQALVNQITVKYRSEGYILSRAILPAQTIEHGVVKVEIIEGYVSHVSIEGDTGINKPFLEHSAQKIMSERPLRISTLERSLLLLNDIPGMSVRAVINASKTVPGSADVALVTERDRFGLFSSYDNYGTRYLGPQEFGIGAYANTLLFPGDGNTLRGVTVPKTNELQFFEYVHTNPLGYNGARMVLTANYSETHPKFILNDLDVIGRSQNLIGDFAYPLIRSRSKNFFVHGAFNYQNVYSTQLGEPLYQDYIRSLIVGVATDGIDSWRGLNAASLDLEQGFKVLAAKMHVNQSRPKGVPNFTKFDLNLSRLQALGGSPFSIFLAMQGQYSCNPLLATEQYPYGGPEWGRGYDPSEIIGDSAFAGKFEFRFQTSPQFKFLQNILYYTFFDYGIIWNRDYINLPYRQTADSAGIGARVEFMPELNGNLFFAKPISHPVATLSAMNHVDKPWRVFFSLVANV